MKSNKKAQEEMVGFALIIIIVAVILLFFLGLAITNDSGEKELDSYEAESFLQAALQYTTECEIGFEKLDVQDLVFSCINKETCNIEESEEYSCDVLNATLNQIAQEGWQISQESFYKGYELNVTSEGINILNVSYGNITKASKGALQSFAKSGDRVDITLKVYS